MLKSFVPGAQFIGPPIAAEPASKTLPRLPAIVARQETRRLNLSMEKTALRPTADHPLQKI
jgi:hypothetical protein